MRLDPARAHDHHLLSEVGERLAAGTAFRAVGSGTWLHGGGPFADVPPLQVRQHTRDVVAYEPGDLVITVGAGMTCAELAAVTAEHGQMFALTPYGSPDSTIGALVATAAPAPLAHGEMQMRDLVLGLAAMTGTGERIRAGGQVVKNVAGFDLVRLFTGSFGTLGVISEVSLRLHARPPHDDIVCTPLQHDVSTVLPQLVANRAPVPLLLHWMPGSTPTLWARISGNASRAHAMRAHVASLAGVSSGAVTGALETRGPSASTALPFAEPAPEAIVLRLRTPRSDAVPFLLAAREALPHAELEYHVERGSVRAVIPALHAAHIEQDLSHLYRIAAQHGAMHTISAAFDQGRSIPAPRSRLDQLIKHTFDPQLRCNPWRSAPEIVPDHLTSSAA